MAWSDGMLSLSWRRFNLEVVGMAFVFWIFFKRGGLKNGWSFKLGWIRVWACFE